MSTQLARIELTRGGAIQLTEFAGGRRAAATERVLAIRRELTRLATARLERGAP